MCEIQVRTILQDAWAIVAHHLSYKQESDVPKELRRKLNALSGLFETADDQFERIRLARTQYQNKVEEDIVKKTELSLGQSINLDNLSAYIRWKFPERAESNLETVADLMVELKHYDYSRLIDVDTMINRSIAAVLEYEKDDPPFADDGSIPTQYTGVGVIRVAMVLTNPKYNHDKKYISKDKLKEYIKLIKAS